MKIYFILFFVLLTIIAIPVWALGDKAQIGQPAPAFSVKTYDGKVANLKDYAGKYVVLEWYSSVCPCINDHYATGNMQALQKKYTAKNVVWLTVSSHAPESNGSLNTDLVKSKLFAEYKASPTTVLLDHDGKMGTDYGATSTPDMFVINPQGILVYKGALDNKLEESETYNPLTSRNFLVEALDADMMQQKIKVAVTQPYGCDIKFPVNEYTLKN